MSARPKPAPQAAKSIPSSLASITFSEEIYGELERNAGEKMVSVAWVVRDAVEKSIDDRYPIFAQKCCALEPGMKTLECALRGPTRRPEPEVLEQAADFIRRGAIGQCILAGRHLDSLESKGIGT